MKKIKSGFLQRNLALAGLGLKSGGLIAKKWATRQERDAYLVSQMKLLTEDLGLLKGTLMKVGQSLSMYGEHFLPAEANNYLKELQNDSPPLEWKKIKKVLIKEIGFDFLEKVKINPEPYAAASLGQVHIGTLKETGEKLAVKIQYPGIDKCIESDLKTIRSFFTVAQILPKGPRTDQFFEELDTMLNQETDYIQEADWTEDIYNKLKDKPHLVVPKVYKEFSSKRILVTSFEEGVKADDPLVKNLSQPEKNHLGLEFIKLYWDELFRFKVVQTDPHLGNYRIRIEPGDTPNKIILLDFGAMRKVSDSFSDSYKALVLAAADQDKEAILKNGLDIEYLFENDPEDLINKYVEMSLLVGEPFVKPEDTDCPFMDESGVYDWSKTDLPSRVASIGSLLATKHEFRPPPQESVFLDRKLGGTFIFLSVLGLKEECRTYLFQHLQKIKEDKDLLNN